MFASASAIEPTTRERRAFWLRKLHSLTGLCPVGVFLVLHIWTNARALQGRSSFDAAVGSIADQPHRLLLEVFGLALPLAFHAGWGVILTLTARPRLRGYRQPRETSYILQRVTGLVVLAFVLFHLVELRLAAAVGRLDATDYFPVLCATLSDGGLPLRAIAYLLGLAAATYHLANGLRGFCFGWGLTTSRRASRFVGGLCTAFGLGLFALGASTVVYFSTGLRFALDDHSHDASAPRLSCADAAGSDPMSTRPTNAPAPSADATGAGDRAATTPLPAPLPAIAPPGAAP